MDRSGRADCRGKRATQIEQGYRVCEGKDDEGRRVTDPIDPAGGLKYFRCTGVHVRRAVDDGAVLFPWLAVGVWNAMIPTCLRGSETAKSIPACRMRASGKVNSCHERSGG